MIKLIFWLALFLIFYTYLGYFLVLKIVAKFYSTDKSDTKDYSPHISLLIAAFNEENVIADKIRNCKKLNYPRELCEILLGLDGATDKTEAIVRAKNNGLIELFSFEKRRGKAAVLNDLVKKAKGDILIFSDANTMYDKEAIHKLVRHFVNPNVGGVCGKLVLLECETTDVGAKGEKLYWNYESKLKYYEGHIKSVLGANGAIYAIRKELYEPLSEDEIIIDDFVIPLKVVERNYRVLYDSEAIGKEYTGLSIWEEFNRKVRIGTANFNAIKEIKKLLNPARGFIALGLWSHKIFRWFVPFLAVIVFVINIFLLGETVYRTTFAIQVGFYFCVLFGAILNSLGWHKNIFSVFFYFFMVNLALLIGFYRFLFTSQKPIWKPVKRQ